MQRVLSNRASWIQEWLQQGHSSGKTDQELLSPEAAAALAARLAEESNLSPAESDTTGGDERDKGLPTKYKLMAPYPNPFNALTNIVFDAPIRAPIALAIFDVSGRRVRVLAVETVEPGTHTIHWNGRDDSGRALASGIYFCRFETPWGGEVKKLVLLK